jgi:Zn-dependent peptidase ImmA (M78 family)
MQINPKAAESLADPSEYPNLFEDWQVALTVEKSVASQRYTVSHKLLHFVLEYCLPEIKKKYIESQKLLINSKE